MKKTIILFLALAMVTLGIVSCQSKDIKNGETSQYTTYSISYRNFEEALNQCTDIVIAEYIGNQEINDGYVKSEFIVKDKILGNKQNNIFVYNQNANYTVADFEGRDLSYNGMDIEFKKGSEYLLVLENVKTAYSDVDIIYFSYNIFIPMDNLSKSTMYGELISNHVKELDFTKKLTKNELISFIGEKTIEEKIKDNRSALDSSQFNYITSDKIEDIIKGSPIIMQIRIDELKSSHKNAFVDVETYACTIIETLYGEVNENKDSLILVNANSVKMGEEYIVAVYNDNNDFFLTSKHSLLTIEQYDEIKSLIKADK